MPTIKVESEWDKTIETIAQSFSDCDAYIALKACDIHSCLHCPTHKQIRNCYDSLSDCDKLAVQNRRKILAAVKIRSAKESSLKYKLRGSAKDIISTVVRIIATIIMTLAMFGMLYVLFSMVRNPYKRTPLDRLPTQKYGDSDIKSERNLDKDTAQLIRALLIETFSNVEDTDNSGTVNCIDYAVTYKRLYDSHYPNTKYRCEIVRNDNPENGFNHLFIRLRPTMSAPWYYIEPQGGPLYYLMYTCWRDVYNPEYNFYGETSFWLEFKVR